MKRKHKRLTFIVVGRGLLAAAAALVLSAFEDNIVFFYSPTEVLDKMLGAERRVRIGGLVEDGSVEKAGTEGKLRVTDLANVIPGTDTGLLPDRFREGPGVVAEGRFVDGVFHADEVLAKHNETYMPPEVAEALKKSGRWREMEKVLKRSGQMTKGTAQ